MYKPTFTQKCNRVGIYEGYRFACKLYKQGMSCDEISEFFKEKYDISITSRYLAVKIKEYIPLRTYSERKLNAIKRGRMVYQKKPEYEKYKSGGLSSKQRMLVLNRDKFKCTLCGNSPQNGYTIEIHHKNGTSSDIDNLQTLCYMCHRGLHYTKRDDK